jgi:hypothetical protein
MTTATNAAAQAAMPAPTWDLQSIERRMMTMKLTLNRVGDWAAASVADSAGAREAIHATLNAVRNEFKTSPLAQELATLRGRLNAVYADQRTAEAKAIQAKADRVAALAAGGDVDAAEDRSETATAKAAKFKSRAVELDAIVTAAENRAKAALQSLINAASGIALRDAHADYEAAKRKLPEILATLLNEMCQAEVAVEAAIDVSRRLSQFVTV